MTRNTRADYERCAAAGMTRRQAAEHLGAGYDAVRAYAYQNGIAFAPSKHHHIGRSQPVEYVGKAFPSQRALARAIGVNECTITRALNRGDVGGVINKKARERALKKQQRAEQMNNAIIDKFMQKVARVHSAIGEPEDASMGGIENRARIVLALRKKAQPIGDLTQATKMDKSSVKWHLCKLEDMGLARRAEVVGCVQIWEAAR
jgi:DNA-binding transcriptional ArsR family regulator